MDFALRNIREKLASLYEAPCKELKPFEPFPFRSSRISKGIRYKHYLILFPFYPEYKKCQHLYTFNLETRKWGSAQFRKSPEVLENTDNYKIFPADEGRFILVGCYKTFQGGQGGNLFSMFQTTTLKKAFGFIDFIFDKEKNELILSWEECGGMDKLPYLEKFSANLLQNNIYIFGGCDENGRVTDGLFKFDLSNNGKGVCFRINLLDKNELLEMDHCSKTTEEISARMGHGSRSRGVYVEIFGGEDENSISFNDYWLFDMYCSKQMASCMKYDKKPNFCYKLGTPCIDFHENEKSTFIYIGKSITQTLRSYLCIDVLDQNEEKIYTWSQKDPLPSDGVPHTMEIFEGKLILGFESSVYSIDIKRSEESLAPNYESYFEDSNDVMVGKKNRPKNFKGHMRQYFEERPFPDVTFRVQEEEISAHRGILSVRCPFFGELFGAAERKDEEEEGKNKLIKINDLSVVGFNALLEWLYCNEIVDMKDNIAEELLKVTNKYSLPKLKTEAENCLMKNLTIENILTRAKLAAENNARDLETAVVKFIVKNLDDVRKRQEFDGLPSSIVERVENMKASEKKLDSLFKNTF